MCYDHTDAIAEPRWHPTAYHVFVSVRFVIFAPSPLCSILSWLSLIFREHEVRSFGDSGDLGCGRVEAVEFLQA
jgi:hypothetical protein